MTKGYIYQIVSHETKKCYIGSTCLDLNIRFRRHLSAYRKWLIDPSTVSYCSSYKVLASNPVYLMLEEFEYNDKTQLRKLENFYIRLFKGSTVNMRKPHFVYEQYYEENKDRLKQYYIDNSERKKTYQLARYYFKRELKYYNI